MNEPQDTLAERVRALRLDGQLAGVKDRKSGLTWLPWSLAAVLALSWSLVGIRWYGAKQPVAPAPTASETPAPTIEPPTKAGDSVGLPSEPKRTGEIVLEKKGYVIPAHQIAISPVDVAGRVIELNFVEGQIVEKGFVLAKLDSTSFDAEAKEAKAAVEEAAANAMSAKAKLNEAMEGSRKEEIEQGRAELREASSMQDQYRREWDRYRTQSAATITTRERDQAESAFLSGQARVDKLKKTVELLEIGPRQERKEQLQADYNAAVGRYNAAKAKQQRTDWRLGNCTITAPVNGMILTKKAELGNLINPVVGGVSTSLCEMADLRDLEVELEIDERDLAKIFEGQACTIKPDAYPKRIYNGYVNRIMPIANRGKAIVPVRVKIVLPADEKQGEYLKPEMNSLVSLVNAIAAEYPKAPTAPPKGKP